MKCSAIITACVAALILGGCFKSVSYDTTCIIRPYVQTENQGPFESFRGVKAYAFAVDTADWMVASYDDAVAGVLTSKHILTDKLTAYAAASEPYAGPDTLSASSDWVQMRLADGSMMMIVAADTVHKLFAYRQQWLAQNLDPFYIALQLRSWRESYSDGGWRVVNEFYVEPEKPENPGDSENPENPGGSENPENPENSGNSENPTE